MMRRVGNALYETAFALFSLASRIINALLFGGSMHQTLSSRAHVDAAVYGGRWVKRRDLINGLFFWQIDHCKEAFDAEVKRAVRTITLNDMTAR